MRKLYRDLENGMLAGICSGLGKYFTVDPTLIRLIFVLATFFAPGSGVVLYALMWVIVPVKPLTMQ